MLMCDHSGFHIQGGQTENLGSDVVLETAVLLQGSLDSRLLKCVALPRSRNLKRGLTSLIVIEVARMALRE